VQRHVVTSLICARGLWIASGRYHCSPLVFHLPDGCPSGVHFNPAVITSDRVCCLPSPYAANVTQQNMDYTCSNCRAVFWVVPWLVLNPRTVHALVKVALGEVYPRIPCQASLILPMCHAILL